MASTNPSRTNLLWSLATGFVTALVAFAVAVFLVWGNSSWTALMPAAPIATFLAAFLATWLLLTYLRPVTIWKGVGIGVIAGLLAHPFTWYLMSLYLYFSGTTSSLREPTLNPIEALWGSLILSLFSLAIIGWITIPISAVGGALLVYLYKKRGM
jgi:hypothetical protein